MVLIYYSSHGLSHEEVLKILNRKCNTTCNIAGARNRLQRIRERTAGLWNLGTQTWNYNAVYAWLCEISSESQEGLFNLLNEAVPKYRILTP